MTRSGQTEQLVRYHPAATLLRARRVRERGGSFLISWRKLVTLVCLTQMVGVAPPALGQTTPALGERYLQTVWTTEEGLPQNSVTAIVQTRDGYIWLATFGGLARFDGVRFTVFNPVNAPALKSQRITALYEDSFGTLWIGTETGEIARYRDGEFLTFDGKAEQGANKIFLDDKNFLWVGDWNGATRYALSGDGFTAKERIAPPVEGKQSAQILAIAEDASGAVWLANYGFDGKAARLLRWRDGEMKIFTAADGLPDASAFPEQKIFLDDLKVDRAGTLWVADASGLYRFDGERFVRDFPAERRGDGKRLFSIDRDGDVWASLDDGAAKLADGRWIKYQHAPLLKLAVRSFLADREGNLWLGTTADGLVRLKRSFVETFDETRGIVNNHAVAILETRDGEIFAAGYGLHRFENGKFARVPEIESTYLTALGETRDGTLYVGGYNEFDERRGGVFVDRETEIKSFLDGGEFVIKSIFEDTRGNLWLGLSDGLLRRGADGKYQKFGKADGLPNEQVHFIAEAKDGALWFGTLGGASRFDGAKFTNYTTADGLVSNNVRAIQEDADGAMWFGTYGGGLSRLQDGQIKTITMRDGLFDDVVSRIIADEQDNFWMLGNHGIFVAARNDLHAVADGRSRQVNCRSYGTADGMLTSEGNGGNQPAGWRTRNGAFWFPTIRGYVRITPAPPEKFTPPAVIEEVRLENQTLDARQPIEIKPGQENLEIRYTGLSFTKPEAISFRYQLEGLDDDWNEAGTRRTAYYSYLPPGAYTFKVMAENGDDVWSEQPATISVVVRPPFWRTWRFVSLCLLCVVGLAFVIHRWRVRQLKRRHAAQEDFSRQLLDSQERERRRIAAELHDGLGQSLLVIKNRVFLALSALEDQGATKDQLDEISASASQAVEEVREITYNLRPYHLDRFGLTKALRAVAAQAADSSGIRFSSEIENIDGLFPKEAETSIYRIVQESVNNIIKHSRATEAELIVGREGRAVRLHIRDDGQGFGSTAGKDTAPRDGGFGLIGMAERARMLGGAYAVDSAPGRGTTITINLIVPGDAR